MAEIELLGRRVDQLQRRRGSLKTEAEVLHHHCHHYHYCHYCGQCHPHEEEDQNDNENTEVTKDDISLPSKRKSKKSKRVTSEKLTRFRALELRLNQLQAMQQQLLRSRKRCNVVESSESENEPLPSHTDNEEVPPK